MTRIRVITFNLAGQSLLPKNWLQEIQSEWTIINQTDEYDILFTSFQEDHKNSPFSRAIAEFLAPRGFRHIASAESPQVHSYGVSANLYASSSNVTVDESKVQCFGTDFVKKALCTKSSVALVGEITFVAAHLPIDDTLADLGLEARRLAV